MVCLEKISAKEGQTVNVGSLLGMINGSTKKHLLLLKRLKTYSPPKKEKQNIEIKSKPPENKKEMKPLKLEEEETLILEELVETETSENKKLKKNRSYYFSSC